MATYDSLTPEQKANFGIYDQFMRGVVSSLMKVSKGADAETMNQFAIDQIDQVLGTLDDAEVIPNSTDLGGAQDLTVAEFKTLQAFLRGLVATKDGNRALLVKAAGVNS